jgi:SAM-dependent methyltransferase
MTATFDWTSVAPAWDRHRQHAGRHTAPVSEALLAAAAATPGDRVLELASGTGDLARRLAEQVGPTGRVLATDAAQGMVDLAAATLADLPQAETAVIDAARPDLDAGTFDAVVCGMGLMFVPDPAAALMAWRPLLASGGRLAVAVWGDPSQNLWASSLGMAAAINGLVAGGPPATPGGMFSLPDPDALAALARDAGFLDVQVTQVAVEFGFPSTDEHFAVVGSMAGPLAVLLQQGTPDLRDAVRATTAQVLADHVQPDGAVRLGGSALVLSGHA